MRRLQTVYTEMDRVRESDIGRRTDKIRDEITERRKREREGGSEVH